MVCHDTARRHLLAAFPFAAIDRLRDDDIPIEGHGITGWSPFIPTDADNSSLPVARSSIPPHQPWEVDD